MNKSEYYKNWYKKNRLKVIEKNKQYYRDKVQKKNKKKKIPHFRSKKIPSLNVKKGKFVITFQ